MRPIQKFKKNFSLNVNEVSSFYLSYIGDALFELWCRQKILHRFKNRRIVHNCVVNWVRCQTQAKIATIIMPVLTPEEKNIFCKGLNIKVNSHPKHATVKEYRQASGFECLVGYFYLREKTDRFEQLMKKNEVSELMESILNKNNRICKQQK